MAWNPTIIAMAKRRMSGTHGMPEEQAKALCHRIKQVIAARYDGNQSAAARAWGISQPQVNAIMNSQGAGVAVLIKLRKHLQVTLDDLIGLPPLEDRPADPRLMAFEEAIDRGVARALARLSSSEAPPALPAPQPQKRAR